MTASQLAFMENNVWLFFPQLILNSLNNPIVVCSGLSVFEWLWQLSFCNIQENVSSVFKVAVLKRWTVQTTITQESFSKLGFDAHLTVSWREPQEWCLPWEQRQSFLCSTLQDVSLWSSWLNEPYGGCARQHNQRTASAWVLLMLMSKYQICV